MLYSSWCCNGFIKFDLTILEVIVFDDDDDDDDVKKKNI